MIFAGKVSRKYIITFIVNFFFFYTFSFTGVVGGVAAASLIGYVAYTKVFAKGASMIAKKAAMADQAHVASEGL